VVSRWGRSADHRLGACTLSTSSNFDAKRLAERVLLEIDRVGVEACLSYFRILSDIQLYQQIRDDDRKHGEGSNQKSRYGRSRLIRAQEPEG